MASPGRRAGAPSRARGRGGVPSLSLERPPLRPLLDRRRRREHTRTRFRPPERTDLRQGRGRANGPTPPLDEHGDLIDLIRLCRGLEGLAATMTEARAFLALPRPEPARALAPAHRPSRNRPKPRVGCSPGGRSAARWPKHTCAGAASRPTSLVSVAAFPPGCYYRASRWPRARAGPRSSPRSPT